MSIKERSPGLVARCKMIISQIKEIFQEKSLSERLKDFYGLSKIFFIDQKTKISDLKKTNFDLGVIHFNKANLADAIFRFKIVSFFAPLQYPDANYYLGRCYLEKGKFKLAAKYFKQCDDQTQAKFKQEIAYCNKAMDKEDDTISYIPNAIIAHNMDCISSIYDKLSFIEYGYDTPEKTLSKALHSWIKKKKSFGNNVLEISPCTGLIGAMIFDSRLTGSIECVEISKDMSKICTDLEYDEAKIYDEVHNTNLDDFILKTTQDKFDIFITSRLFFYNTHIKDILLELQKVANKGSVIAFNIKVLEESEVTKFPKYRFIREDEEFLYNKDFVLQQIKDALCIVHKEEKIEYMITGNTKKKQSGLAIIAQFQQ